MVNVGTVKFLITYYLTIFPLFNMIFYSVDNYYFKSVLKSNTFLLQLDDVEAYYSQALFTTQSHLFLFHFSRNKKFRHNSF